MTEETQIWVRMAIDRQLLGLQHALLWLELSDAEAYPCYVGLTKLLYELKENATAAQIYLTPSV